MDKKRGRPEWQAPLELRCCGDAMSRGTRQRNFRCEDELWEEAKEAADERGDNLSDIIRQALTTYIKESGKQ